MSSRDEAKRYTLHLGDCIDVLKTLPENSVDSIVTDPPAGISFMGKEWDSNRGGSKQWINWMTGVMREALRVAKPGAHALVWALPRTSHWTAMACEWAGWEVRDVVMHLFGSGFPKSLAVDKAIDEHHFQEWLSEHPLEKARLRAAKTDEERKRLRAQYLREAGLERPASHRNPSKRPNAYVGQNGWETPHRPEFKTSAASAASAEWEGWGTALKPAAEHWLLLRKPIVGTVAANVLAYGTGGLNVDASRIAGAIPQVPQPLFNSPTGRTYGMKTGEGRNGETSRGEGRFPSHLIFDPEAAAMLDAQSGHLKTGGPVQRRNGIGYGGGVSKTVNSKPRPYEGNEGGASRFFYTAKPSKSERDFGLSSEKKVTDDGRRKPIDNPFLRGETLRRNAHPTVKPFRLMRYLVRLITPPGATVLDPFMGSGTTGAVAVAGGWRFIGIEKDPESYETARARIGSVKLKEIGITEKREKQVGKHVGRKT